MGRDTDWFPWYYEELDKRIWRSKLSEAGFKVPAQVVDWDGKKLTVLKPEKGDNQMWWDSAKKGKRRDLLIKLYNTWASYGDLIFKDYDESPEKIEELRNVLKNNYDGVETLIMDLHQPDKYLGKHAFDIRTMKCPDGSY